MKDGPDWLWGHRDHGSSRGSDWLRRCGSEGPCLYFMSHSFFPGVGFAYYAFVSDS